ncbi:hypothetical protein GCM10018980_20190 [Streptomyces capoamus]|uniref:Uncharacterized protein n=1 Tax=Streptomyces capoamus TaxID=68183 RepID=A0A919C2K2_9ACTN|nr:hypothetical protein GCM10010501_33780 [Streptomyces libani subsp. rufus]GHG43319.1 hypothetical protein GCM10018980_20190 [Streptomyces capoamus]
MATRGADRVVEGVEPGPRHLAPPAPGYRCQYVTDWIADKIRWALSIDATERNVLAGQVRQQPITVTLARSLAAGEQPLTPAVRVCRPAHPTMGPHARIAFASGLRARLPRTAE